jgi:HEAT repeat protein
MEALRRGLESRYRSVQAHCARSLGSLGDRSVIPLLLERLETDEDAGLQMALASALGKLEATEAAKRLLDLLRSADSQDVQQSLSLALARLVGEEHGFIQLLRNMHADAGTALSQEVTRVKGRLRRAGQLDSGAEEVLDAAAEALAQGALETGVELLLGALEMLPMEQLEETGRLIVEESVEQMGEFGAERLEYVVLALHALCCRRRPQAGVAGLPLALGED